MNTSDRRRGEGAVQVFYFKDRAREPILAAVGQLQFDVVRFRLEAEYGVETRLEPLAYSHVRWLEGTPEAVKAIRWPGGTAFAEDVDGRPVGLFNSEWSVNYVAEKHPGVKFHDALLASNL